MPARVLVVDDVARDQRLMEARLARNYIYVSKASNGADAIARARAEQPDVILLKASLPGLDGCETCRRLKADEATARLSVVVVNQFNDRAARAAAVDAGADDILTEPIDDMALLGRIRSLGRLKAMYDELRLRSRVSNALGAGVGSEMLGDAALAGARVLLIEDGGLRTERKAQALAGVAEVRVESTAMAGLRAARSGQYDVVIASLEMPDLGAVDLVRQLRRGEMSRQAPLLVIADTTQRDQLGHILNLGAEDYFQRPVDDFELIARTRAQIRRRRYVDYLRHRLMASLALTIGDPLTGLYNRRYLNAHLDLTLKAVPPPRIAALTIDIGGMQTINRRFGFEAGDHVLRDCATRLQRNLRGFDLACRFDEHTFAVILGDIDRQTAARVGDRLYAAITRNPIKLRQINQDLSVDCAVGVAAVRIDDTAALLMDRAFEALGAARRQPAAMGAD